MFYTVVTVKTDGLKPGEGWSEWPNLRLPNTDNGRKIWLEKIKSKIPPKIMPYLKKGGFIFGPDLFKNFTLLYYPKYKFYVVSFDIYFEDTYNEGEKKILQYIKKTGLLEPEVGNIKYKYIQL